jgi:hypothetical protein
MLAPNHETARFDSGCEFAKFLPDVRGQRDASVGWIIDGFVHLLPIGAFA